MAGYPYSQGQWPPPPSQQQPPPQQAPAYPHFAQYDYRPPSNPPVLYGGGPYQAPPNLPPQGQPHPGYYGAVQASQAAYEYNAQASGLGIAMESSGQRSPNAVGGDLSWSEAFPTAASASASTSLYPSHNPPGHHAQPQQQHYNHAHAPQPVPPRAVYSPPAYQVASKASQAYNPESAIVPRASEPEEGELSEDDEDPYEPEETSGSTGNDNVTASRSPTSRDAPGDDGLQVALGQAAADLPSRDASVIDTQDDAFYDEDEDEEPGEIKSEENSRPASDAADADNEDTGCSDSEPKTVPHVGGERAGSYSPRLSPGEVEQSVDDEVANEVAKGVQPSVDSAAASAASVVAQASADPVNGESTVNSGTGEASRGLSVNAGVAAPVSKQLPYSSVDDAKKEAQRAILRLIPYGVNYQTYIAEGFDEKLVKPLFAELGLKAAPVPTESTAMPKSVSPTQAAEAAGLQPEPVGNDGAPKKEERKDRIARLLALKASKPAPVPVAVKPPVAVLLPKFEKVKSQKAILLQQRLEALKQAQEQRAAAATKAAAEASALGDIVSGQQSQVAAAIVDTIADKAAAISAALSPPTPPTSTRQRPVAADFTDLSAAELSQNFNNPLKRPFELTRQRSSMVIEVSDDSAEEDVAMELDSQADDSASKTAETTSRRESRAQLYRDDSFGASNGNNYNHRHHAHTDGSFSAPRPGYGGRAPPTAPASMLARPKDDEYARKMREIELMKRKIAEAEAKKARGSPTGSRTSQTGDQQMPPENGSDGNGNGNGSGNDNSGDTSDISVMVVRPPPQPFRRITSTGELSGEDRASSPLASVEASPARLLKRTSGPSPAPSRENHREKRMRVTSLQLPRVEASLQEKMFKLRLLQDKVAALQAEIDAGVAEKRRLTEDIEDLATGSEEESSEREASMHLPLPPMPAQVDDVIIPVAECGKGQEASSEVEMDVGANAKVDVEAPVDAGHAGPDDGGGASQTDDDNGAADGAAESVAMSDASSPYEPTSGIDDEDIEMVDEEVDEEEDKDDESGKSGGSPVDDADAVGELFDSESQPQQNQKRLPRPALATKPASAGVRAGTLSSVFVPYESPLQYFRSYRYHPQYKARVPGGFRSLTYSGKIQDDIALCPTETADGTCSDAACPFQHFATIVPKDDQILVELGRADDYTGEQKARFVDGLTSLLKKIRDDKERDFNKIAESILDFRRTFLGDDTRIVSHLEGVTV
ncbi:hypothetical protein SCUCBS95973_008199 [Sporothrix curviconia]|uniref:Putative zinc-finger domain-containing protein n=1 Tax=Sporothrix curviconia TaxID=1260050 RepID=A0ABP0CJW9_9PEZI